MRTSSINKQLKLKRTYLCLASLFEREGERWICWIYMKMTTLRPILTSDTPLSFIEWLNLTPKGKRGDKLSHYKWKTTFLTTWGANLGITGEWWFEGNAGRETSISRHRPSVWTLGEVFLAQLGRWTRWSAFALRLNRRVRNQPDFK
jgi:hypothetical protein